ncbi:MAG: hypothetical protein HOV80_11160 [Polyangiaceae bacterium]|nr:hypothetical protein [Polyangiaceae bacterium]
MHRLLVLLVVASVPAGCEAVLGTDDLFACEDETCPEGGGGGGNAPSTSTSTGTGTGSTSTAVSGSTGTGTACFNVTMNVSGNVEVKVEGPQDIDFNAGSMTVCLFAGATPLHAECADGENKGDPASVVWGNPSCADGSICSLDLQKPETFTVSLVDAASCP